MNREEGFKRLLAILVDGQNDDWTSTLNKLDIELKRQSNVIIHDELLMSIKFDEGVDEIEKYIIDNGKVVGDHKPIFWSKYIIKNDVFMVTRRYSKPGSRGTHKSTIICDKSSIDKIITKPLMLCGRTVIQDDQEIRDWMSSP